MSRNGPLFRISDRRLEHPFTPEPIVNSTRVGHRRRLVKFIRVLIRVLQRLISVHLERMFYGSEREPSQNGGETGRLVPHTGFEPVISALRGRCPGPLDECGTGQGGAESTKSRETDANHRPRVRRRVDRAMLLRASNIPGRHRTWSYAARSAGCELRKAPTDPQRREPTGATAAEDAAIA